MESPNATKKNRLIRWVVGLIVIALILAGIALATVTRHPGLTQDWTQTINARLSELEPEGEPAWPIYRDILRNDLGIRYDGSTFSGLDYANASPLLQRFMDISDDPDIPWPNDALWSDPRLAPYRELEPMATEVFRKLDLAAERPRMGKPFVREGSALTGDPRPEQGPSLPTIPTPVFQSLGRLSRIHSLRLHALSEKGSWEEFADAMRTQIVLAEHSAAGLMVDLLGGVSMLSRSLDTTRYALIEFDIPANEARRIDAIFDEHADLIRWVELAMELETLYAYGSIETSIRVTSAFGPSLEDMKAEYHAMAREVTESFNLPGSEFAAFYERMSQQKNRPSLAETAQPAFASFTRSTRFIEREVRATRLMLRLEAIHAETGQWPDALGDHPELAELNECPLTGDPFVYTRTPNDEHNRAYTLHAPETPWEEMIKFFDFTEPREPFEPQEPTPDF